MSYMKLVSIAGTAAMLAACQTAAERAVANEALASEIALRQGERVGQICFLNTIDGWRALGRNALLIREGRDWYKLDLTGSCEPDWAFNAIAVRTRGASSCLSRGDRIDTLDTAVPGSCIITSIYEWDDDAQPEAEGEDEN